jgi:thymidylate kinase
VNEHVVNLASQYGVTATAHLGKQQGNVGRSLANLPIIGKLIDRLIERKVATVHSSHKEKKTPGVITAFVMYLFTLRRVKRFKRMLDLRKQGNIIITDRFPQLDYPRAYDGPDLDASAEGNFIVRWLAKREQLAFEWMTSHRPDLILRLNVDLDTACARKPDHLRERLERKIKVTPLLKFNGAPIAEIDASKTLKEVQKETENVINDFLNKWGYQLSKSK